MEKSWVTDLGVSDSTKEILSYEKHSNPTLVLRLESFKMLNKINLSFFEYANHFNYSLKGDSTPLKVLGITNKQSFIVFRNNFRLIISIFEPGVIYFSFENFSGNIYATEAPEAISPDEVYNSGNILVGKLGPFNEITWLFEEKEVKLENVIRHYFTEFIKASTSFMKSAPASFSLSVKKKN